MSPAEPQPTGGQGRDLPGAPAHERARPRLCLPPPLCVPAPRGHGLNSIVTWQCPSTAIATHQPGVEGAAVPHDGEGAQAVLGGCGRRGLPLPGPARLSPPPARGRRLVSPLPGEVSHPGGRASLLSPIPGPDRGFPTPDFARPPPGRGPSPVQGLAAPVLRAQTPPGAGVRAGGGGAVLPGVPAVLGGLGQAAAAVGAGHG